MATNGSKKMTPVIRAFMKGFASNQKAYKTISTITKTRIKRVLDREGIMAIVSARVKDPDRLLIKLVDRNKNKQYTCDQDIFDDIPDLVGARIALYFPSDAGKVEELLKREFILQPRKKFPEDIPLPPEMEPDGEGGEKPVQKFTACKRKVYPGYQNRRFDGYCATHHRGKLRRFPNINIPSPTIEIQVASVLMHAWSEVEHDLAYKNLMGQVSNDEYEALDEINGLVIAGELALNRLERMSQERMKKENVEFTTQFALAAFLEEWLREWYKKQKKQELAPEQIFVGNVEALFRTYSRHKEKITKRVVQADLNRIVFDEKGLLADQLSALYDKPAPEQEPEGAAPAPRPVPEFRVEDPALFGMYLVDWINLQRRVKAVLREKGYPVSVDSDIYGIMREEFDLSERVRKAYISLYMERNKIVHGNYAPAADTLNREREDMVKFLKYLEEDCGT